MLVLIVGLHCILFEGGVGGADGWSYFANLQSLVDDYDLDLTNNRFTFPREYAAQPYMKGHNDRYVTHEPIGATFFQVPFYLVGKAAATVLKPNLKINRVPYSSLDGETLVKVFSMVFANNFWSILAVLLVYHTARRAGVREWPAFWAALFCFFGGPLHWYATVGLSHAVDCFCTALLLYTFLRALQTEGGRRLLLIGLTGLLIGLSSSVRYTDGLMLFPFMLYFLVENRRSITKLVKEEIALGLGCCLTVWITFAYWKVQFGGWFTHTHAESGEFHLTIFPPPLAKILFSDQHGFFPFNPVFLLTLVGLVWMLLKRQANEWAMRHLSIVAFLSFCACAFIYDSYIEWAGHGTYSTRFLTNGVILLAPGLAYFLNEVKWKRIAYALAGLAVAFSYALFFLSRARLIYQHGDPASVGLRLSDYTYIFREGIPLRTVLSEIVASSLTLNLIASKTPLLCAAVGGCAVFIGLAVFYLRRLRPRLIQEEAQAP
ncbi:MAG: glycosyltransferase family 39 protein [Planctomycetota bacterium]